jgi:hypothetical protein
MTIIAEAEAFDNAEELISFYGAAALVSETDSLELAMGAGYRAEFIATGIQFRRQNSGKIDWASVQRLKLLKLKRSR